MFGIPNPPFAMDQTAIFPAYPVLFSIPHELKHCLLQFIFKPLSGGFGNNILR